MKTIGKTLVVVMSISAGVAAFRSHWDRPVVPTVSRALVAKGDVVQVVTATGTLAPVRSVAVGSQVSGIVTQLRVDYNAVVKKGEVLAEIDSEKARTQLESAEASLSQAKSARDSDTAVLENDTRNRDRTETLFADHQATLEDKQNAEVSVEQDKARLEQDRELVATANSNIEQARVAVEHCTITSPIDGVVVARDVDQGQTVNASVTSPTIYELASDLTSLRLAAAIDEADVSAVRAGQTARFTVEAYPGRTFYGTVREVRLNASSVNNVVTYQTMLDVRNQDLRLRPGMTARITLEVNRANDVLRVPVVALRFRPAADAVQAFPDTVLPAVSRAATIAAGGTGAVWRVDQQRLVRVPVTLGLTDGTWVEVTAGDVKEGDSVITAITSPDAPGARGPAGARNPFAPRPRFRGRF